MPSAPSSTGPEIRDLQWAADHLHRSTPGVLRLGGVRLGAQRQVTAGPLFVPPGLGFVTFVQFQSGGGRYWLGKDQVTASDGSTHVLSEGGPIDCVFNESTTLLWLSVPLGSLPRGLADLLNGWSGPVALSAIMSTLCALAGIVLDPIDGGIGHPATGAIRPLLLAVLQQAGDVVRASSACTPSWPRCTTQAGW